jgi:two-component system nitrate/nitrite response regulator NarL
MTVNVANPASSINVLIADDHKLVAEAVKVNLQANGNLVVSTCYDLSSLMKLLGATQYDIVLLDLRMPGMMGLESIAKVIAMAGDGYVVLFTGQIDQHLLVKALKLGVRGLIHKALPLQSLGSIIELINSGQVFVPVDAHIANQTTDSQAKNPLNGKELHTLRLAAEGLTNKGIAREMDVTEVTIKMHMRSICKKLGARNRAHAAIIGKEQLL